MTKDDEAAKKARAERLRQQISRLTSQGSNTGQGSDEATDPSHDTPLPHDPQEQSSSSVSPREFIQKRMQELEKGEN